MKTYIKTFLAVAALIVVATGVANATIVTITASGNVDRVSLQPEMQNLMGLNMTATAVYSTYGIDVWPDPNTAVYNTSLQSLTITLGGQFLTGLPEDANSRIIEVDNDVPGFGDNFTAQTFFPNLTNPINFTGLGPWTFTSSALVLRDLDGGLWSNTDLPSSFDLSALDTKFIRVHFAPETSGVYIFADTTITSLNISTSPEPVPEPSTMLLLGGGIAGLAFLRRRKN